MDDTPAQDGWKFEKKVSVSEQIYRHLRTRIISLELPPGTSLSRSELSAFYQASQTPLRDAILRLESEGLLETFPQSRTVVTRIDTKRVREDQFLRSAVEAEICATLATNMVPEAIAPAQYLLKRQIELVQNQGNYQDLMVMDKDFHRQLFMATGKVSLHQLIDERSGQLDRVRRFHLRMPSENKMEKIIEDHSAIMAAIDAGEPERARKAMRHHLSGTLGKLDELVATFPDYFE